MKTRFKLDCAEEIDFALLAINSHIKGYKLCWKINSSMQLNLEKKNDHNIKGDLWFSRYNYISDEGIEYDILANRSKKGYLVPNQKSINYFLIVKNDYWDQDKVDFMTKLRNIADVLLVFEIDTVNLKQIDRFIFNDKEN
tara:strand:+ start:590 stop:1009 length:420 start_codon:yes stop_codon:yes gene_type:complete